MTKKQLFILIFSLTAIVLLVWGIFYAWNLRLAKQVIPLKNDPGVTITTSENVKQPPTLPAAPISGTPEIQTYTGTLVLSTAVAQLKTNGQTYILVTNPQSNFVATLSSRGFVDGDQIALMGKIVAGQIVVSGLNKLTK